MQSLDSVLMEILLTPLVGAMVERGIKPAAKPACEECGEPSTPVIDSECYEQFWEIAR